MASQVKGRKPKTSRPSTVKIGPQVDASLYGELVRISKENGQSQRHLLEKAIEHYIHVVLPSRQMVRADVMEHFRRSTEKNRKLHKLLAQ